MHPEQKNTWIEYTAARIKEQELSIIQKEGDYAQTESAMTSRHDHLREDLAGELNTQYGLLAQQKRFLEEIENGDLRYQVESGAYVDLLIDGQPQQVLFMNTFGNLPSVDVVTPKSPIGQAIKDKIAGEQVTYKVRERIVTVAVRSIL